MWRLSVCLSVCPSVRRSVCRFTSARCFVSCTSGGGLLIADTAPHDLLRCAVTWRVTSSKYVAVRCTVSYRRFRRRKVRNSPVIRRVQRVQCRSRRRCVIHPTPSLWYPTSHRAPMIHLPVRNVYVSLYFARWRHYRLPNYTLHISRLSTHTHFCDFLSNVKRQTSTFTRSNWTCVYYIVTSIALTLTLTPTLVSVSRWSSVYLCEIMLTQTRFS